MRAIGTGLRANKEGRSSSTSSHEEGKVEVKALIREVMIVLTAAEVYRPTRQSPEIFEERGDIPSKFHFKTSGAQGPNAYSNLGFKA